MDEEVKSKNEDDATLSTHGPPVVTEEDEGEGGQTLHLFNRDEETGVGESSSSAAAAAEVVQEAATADSASAQYQQRRMEKLSSTGNTRRQRPSEEEARALSVQQQEEEANNQAPERTMPGAVAVRGFDYISTSNSSSSVDDNDDSSSDQDGRCASQSQTQAQLMLDPEKTESTSPASRREDSLFDNPDYIPPNQQDILLTDVTSKLLHTTIAYELGVKYLSPVEEEPEPESSLPLVGVIHGANKRLMVNVATRRRRRGGDTTADHLYPCYNLFFLCDTGAPNTFICEEAMKVLLGDDRAANDDVLPDALFVQMSDFAIVEAHLSPKKSRFEDVNVIGMDLLIQLKTTINGKNLEFKLESI